MSRKIKNSFFISLFVSLLFYSCSAPKSTLLKYGKVLELVMIKDVGTFRGFNLGEGIDSIRKNEFAKPIEEDQNYLYYEYSLDSVGSYTITYNFDDRGLIEIQSDIYLKNNSEADDAMRNFKNYFNDRFGENENHMGFLVWTVKSEKFGIVRINLSDESDDFITDNAPRKISLWFYLDKE